MAKCVFVVQHIVTRNNLEDVKLIGVYSSLPNANMAIAELTRTPGFKKYPHILNNNKRAKHGFHIGAHELNDTNWEEGFSDH